MSILDASQVSSNWKKLQGQLKAESTTENASRGVKRKHPTDKAGLPIKRSKTTSTTSPQRSQKEASRMATPSGGLSKAKPTMKPTSLNHVFVNHEEGVAHSTSINRDIVKHGNLDRPSGGQTHPSSKGRQTSTNPSERIPPPAVIQLGMHMIEDAVNAGLHATHGVGKYIALDCEMVGTGPPPHSDHVLARVSAVNYNGEQLYDSYVLPPPGIKITDYRTWVSGIKAHHLRPGYARPFREVRKEIAALLEGKVLVGHALRNDLQVLQLSHPRPQLRDTSQYPKFRKTGHGSPALRTLAKLFLGLEIQTGEHSSLEDARATMALFQLERAGFEADVKARYGEQERQEAKRKAKAEAKAEARANAPKSMTDAISASNRRVENRGLDDLSDSELEAMGFERTSAAQGQNKRKKTKKKKRTKRK